MPDKKRLEMEEDIYVDMRSLKRSEKPHKCPDENMYVEIKSQEIRQQITQTHDVSGGELANDVPQFRDQQRPSETGKVESPVVDLTCNCSFPCEGPCANGLVGKKVNLYESLLTDYQKEIQSSKINETSIEPPPRKKKSIKRESSNESSSSIKHSEAKRISLSEKKEFVKHSSLSALDASAVDSSTEVDDESTSRFKSDGFRSLFTSTPVNEGSKLFPRRNSSLPDLQVAADIISISEGMDCFEEHSLDKQVNYNERDSAQVGNEIDEEDQDSNNHRSKEQKRIEPERPSRKKSGILSIHSDKSSDKHGKAQHAKFCFPAISNVKRQNDLIKTSASIRASVNILDWSRRHKGVPRTMSKAHSVAALTPHEHANPSNLNVRRRLDKTKRMQTLRQRINNALGLQKSDSSCWPKVFRRKKKVKRINSGRFMKRSAKPTSQSTESFASIFFANEKKMSTTLPDNWKHEVISEDLFTSDVQESVEFPEHVSMAEGKGKVKRRTLRERLLSPKRLLSKDSTTSFDSIALKKAIGFLENSLHPSGSNNETNTNTNEKVDSVQSLNRQESDEYVGASSETLDSITSARSAGAVQRAMSHDSSAEQPDFFKKISLKTKFFLRTTSIPDMAPRILKAFSKNTTSSCTDDRISNEVLEGATKPGKFSNRLKRDTLANLGSLFSTEPIKENDEDEVHGDSIIQLSDTCSAEVHGVIDAQPISEVIKTEEQAGLENTVLDDESCFEPTVISNERKLSIVVTDENLHDHLLTVDNINELSDSENETQLPVLAEKIGRVCTEEKMAKGLSNTESEVSKDSLISPQDILEKCDGLNTDDSYPHLGDNLDIVDDSGITSVKENVTGHAELENSSALDAIPSSTVDDQNHKSSEELDVCERSEVTHQSVNGNESTVLSDSENETQLPVLAEKIGLVCTEEKMAKGLSNTESEVSKDSLISPQDILEKCDGLNTDDSYPHLGDNLDIVDDSGITSVKENVTGHAELENSSALDAIPSSTVDDQNHKSSEELDVCERSEVTHQLVNGNVSSYQIKDNSEETICGDGNPNILEVPANSPSLTQESKSFKKFAVSISPLKSENSKSKCNEDVIVNHVLKTERCVDTGRTVITYNAPVNGEHVKIDLHEIDPNVISLEKCADTGRTVISCQAGLNRLDSLDSVEGKVQEPSAGDICSDPIVQSKDVLDNILEQCSQSPVDTTSSELNQLWDSLESSPCNDCESPSCGIPIISIYTDFPQEDTIVSEELHQEITSWKLNMCNEKYLKNNTRSNLMPLDDRRRIRANSIPESDFEFEEETDEADSNNLKRTIMEGIQNKNKLQNSEFPDEKENGRNSSTVMAVPQVSSSDNMLNISTNDDFFDFFRDRAQEEHYAYILESDSENEEECAKAVVEYLANARRSSIDTLLSQKTDDVCHLTLQKVNVETGSLALSDCSSRRSSRIEPIEPIKDDIFDFFDGGEKNESEKDIKADCTIGETKLNSDISQTSDMELAPQSSSEGHLDNMAGNVSDKDANDTIGMSDNLAITESFLDKSDNELNKIDVITSSECVNINISNTDDSKYGEVSPSTDTKSDNVHNSVLVGGEKRNDITEISDHIEVSVNEDCCENDLGVKIYLDEIICNGDKRKTSSCENISDNCQIGTGINIDAQKNVDVEKSSNKLQRVEMKSNEVEFPELDINIQENEEKNNSSEEQKRLKESNETFADSASTKQIEPNFFDNKREIVRKENTIANTKENFSKREKEENATNISNVVAPSKPPRLFTVRLIPEHAWRSQSTKELSRKRPKSLQPEPRDLHVTKSFNDLPAELDSVSHSFAEGEIIRKIHSDVDVSTDESFQNRVNQIPDSVLSARFLDLPKMHETRRGSFLQENDDFYDYFENPKYASDVDSRPKTLLRLDSNDTSDVTGFSILRPDMHYNSELNGAPFCDSVPMIKTKLSLKDQCETNLTQKTIEQLAAPTVELGSETHSNKIISVNSTLEDSEISPTEFKESKQIESDTKQREHVETPSVSQIVGESLNDELDEDNVKATSVEHHSTTLLPSAPDGDQNRRHSFIDENDDFFDYFDRNTENVEEDRNSSGNIYNESSCLVNESNNDSELEIPGNVTCLSKQSHPDNSTATYEDRTGSFIEDSNEHLTTSVNKSSVCDAVEFENTKSGDSLTQTIICQQSDRIDNEINGDGIIHKKDDTEDSVIRSTRNFSDDMDINVTPISSKSSNAVDLDESSSDFSHVRPFESRQLPSNNSENEQLTEQLDDTAEDEVLSSSLVVDDEELAKDVSRTDQPYAPTDYRPTSPDNDDQPPSDMPKNAVPVEAIKSDEHECRQSRDSHHIESIIKKDNAAAGPRRRSVTFSLPLLEIPAHLIAETPQSSYMVGYSSNEDPFEYFGSCEPVSSVLKDDPFDYFTTSSTVSASKDIVDDLQSSELQNTTETSDQSASHNNGDIQQHEPQLHNPHRRESHTIELLTIDEANSDLLAIEEASYETTEETNCTLKDATDSQSLSAIDEPQEILPNSDSIESAKCILDSSTPGPPEANLNELKLSDNSLDSTTKEIENADAVSQQKPVILELVPKEMSEVTNDQEEGVRTSGTELNKPSMSEFLIELPVAKVFEIIDAAEKSGSTTSLSKVAEDFVTNSPQYRTKFKHPDVSSENKNERSTFPKAVSVSYETLLDAVDDSCNRIPPFLPTYCHARKALFPNVSTSNLSTLEKMDDNYSPRSLALGRPTIILQTWFDRQNQGHTFMKPARSSSDLVEMFSSLSVPQNTPSVCRSESLPPRKRPDTPSPGTPVDQFKEDSVEPPPPRQEERVQQDRSLDVYPETLRQRQRPRNMAPSPSKVDIKNWNQNGTPIREPESPASGKKFLPSVKALRSQFETGKNLNSSSNNGSVSPTSTFSMSSSSSNASTGSTQGCGGTPTSVGGSGLRAVADPTSSLARKLSGSSLASSSLEKSSSNTSLNSAPSTENLLDGDPHDPDEPVEPIFCQFQKVDEELRDLMSRPTSTSGWDPRSLLKRLYYVPEVPRIHSKGHSYVNIEGYLEKLPSGRKKATFWNAWKRRYFVAKDGVLYYYQNSQCDKQSLQLTLMGGKVETMEGNMVGVDDGVASPQDKAALMLGLDDGKGHYVVVRCSSRSEADRWRRALESHLVEDFASQYVQPHPMPTNPSLLRDTLIIDIGSCSVRAGVLTSQATLPQLFFPAVVATDRESRRLVWGQDALAPETRTSASISFPMKPSHRISKFSVDLTALTSLLTKTFSDLKVDPKNYNLQISVPRVLNQHTQSELLKTLFEKFGVKGVNVTHQSILALYAYNATSGIVVDIGERMEIVPVIDGYIVEGGVSRVPYGGCRILDHLRQFLYMRNVSLVNDVESYIIRHVLENACYSAQHYNTEKARCTNHPENFEKTVSLKEFFPSTAQCPYDAVELDFGRFQATEGLFNPDAWGLDHPGLHKLVHKAIQECSMDIRKEMSRSIFLAGGVTQLPGLADRLTTELDNLTPPAIRPKVHVSPYRYHAAYIGACTLAESPAFSQTLITRENWAKNGNAALRKWAL